MKEELKNIKCISCNELAYTKTHSEDGFKEIKISQMCEECFDEACVDDSEENGDGLKNEIDLQ